MAVDAWPPVSGFLAYPITTPATMAKISTTAATARF